MELTFAQQYSGDAITMVNAKVPTGAGPYVDYESDVLSVSGYTSSTIVVTYEENTILNNIDTTIKGSIDDGATWFDYAILSLSRAMELSPRAQKVKVILSARMVNGAQVAPSGTVTVVLAGFRT